MTDPNRIYTTITFIRVQELVESDCVGCVAHDIYPDENDNEILCDHLQSINGKCTHSGQIYIIDHPEHIANYTKQRITK
jgi:hypothetical protein